MMETENSHKWKIRNMTTPKPMQCEQQKRRNKRKKKERERERQGQKEKNVLVILDASLRTGGARGSLSNIGKIDMTRECDAGFRMMALAIESDWMG